MKKILRALAFASLAFSLSNTAQAQQAITADQLVGAWKLRSRAANSALHIIAIGRLRTDQRTKHYVARRIAEGHSKLDAIRALKQYLAREVFPLIMQRQTEINATRIAAPIRSFSRPG